MGKKKQIATTGATAGDGGATTTTTAISGDIKSHAAFFDKLVELIPAKFYLPTDDNKPWFQGLSKSAKAEAKLKSIENTKKSRRDRLDPEKSSKTTLDFLKESLNNEKTLDSDPANLSSDFNGDGGRSVTYEELRQRLRKRIQELRAGRGGAVDGDAAAGGERREKKDTKKRKREPSSSSSAKEKVEKNENDCEKEIEEAAKGIEFGKVKLGEDIDKKKNKKRKMSKAKELERAMKLQEAKKDPEKGEMVAKKHSWKAATERAMGIKVHDNPKLLKESLQKEKRKQKKSVENWKKRVETTEKMKHEKQEKRKGNIKAKIDKKKQKKIEKREKKLLRPGFEGRKEGFITGD